jgi:hypothetical protein
MLHFGLRGAVMLLYIVPLVLLSTAFWIWMLISAIQNKGLGETEKICWVLVILFLNVIGALLYLIIAFDKRNSPPVASSAGPGA